MQKALFISISATGSSPLYSQLTSVTTVSMNDGSFCRKDIPIKHLNEEFDTLTSLCSTVKEYNIILYNDEKDIRYLTECCRQYSLILEAKCKGYLADYIDELNIDLSSARENIPVITGELKHYYKDYKNYYYLPAEDTAYHKSVSEFVDRSARVQATARTAYTKKTGSFVPVFSGMEINPNYAFRKDYSDRQIYIPLEYLDLSDPRTLCSYIFCPHIQKDV